jgi:chromosome segregation ATPase
MARRAAAAETTSHLSETAREHLAGLRRDVESRLAALEEVLADPSRGESLTGLILDLSRVAVAEAQAAAAQACLATKAEADKEIAELRTSAKAAVDAAQSALKSANSALEKERQGSSELRTALENARLEVQKQNELLVAREQLEKTLKGARGELDAELARQKSAATEFQRAAAEAKRQLEAERTAAREATDVSGAQLARERETAAKHARALADAAAKLQEERAVATDARKALERAEERLASLEREYTDSRATHDGLTADLAHARETSAARDRAFAEIQSQLEAERTLSSELRVAAERAEEMTATLGRETNKEKAEQQELASEVERVQKEAAAHQKALAQAQRSLGAAQKELEAERATSANLRREVERAEHQLSSARSSETQALAHHDTLTAELERERTDATRIIESLTAERDKIARDFLAAQQWIDEHREAEAEFQLAARKIEAALAQSERGAGPTEEAWQVIRLATRFRFPEPVAVQVNGDPGKLVDISATGCQLLFPSALKPDQTIKVQLQGNPPITCVGKVVWTRLEPPVKGGLMGYRAGVAFTKSDGDAIEAFVTHHAQS